MARWPLYQYIVICKKVGFLRNGKGNRKTGHPAQCRLIVLKRNIGIVIIGLDVIDIFIVILGVHYFTTKYDIAIIGRSSIGKIPLIPIPIGFYIGRIGTLYVYFKIIPDRGRSLTAKPVKEI